MTTIKKFNTEYYAFRTVINCYVFSQQNKPHECPVCDKSFITKSHLKGHTKTAHGPQVRRRCISCSKTHKEMKNFLAHYKKVHFEKCRNKKCVPRKTCQVCASKIDEAKRNWHINQPQKKVL